jgi:hypothetical protein
MSNIQTLSRDQSLNDFEGRRKHLGQLKLVFKNRGGTFSLLRQFFAETFGGQTMPAAGGRTPLYPMTDCGCRHCPGGRHFLALRNSNRGQGPYPIKEPNPRYEIPCTARGVWEDGKGCGVVVYDLCNRARKWLSEQPGFREPESQNTGKDRTYGPSSNPASSQHESDDIPDSLESGDLEVIEETGELVVPCSPNVGHGSNTYGARLRSGAGETYVDSQREQDPMDYPWDPHDSDVVDDSDLYESQESCLQRGRKSTMVRVATLAYIAKQSSDLLLFIDAFERLRLERDLCVLHLCGCGVCRKGPDGRKLGGCTEPSHLMLGTMGLNKLHALWHECFNQVTDAAYPKIVGVAHEDSDSGRDLF